MVKKMALELRTFDRIALGFALCAAVFSLLCLLLTAFGVLTFLALFFSLGMLSVGTLVICYKKGIGLTASEWCLTAGLLLCLAPLIFTSASEYYWGRWDPGIYNGRAFAMMDSGGMYFHDKSTDVLGAEWPSYYEQFKPSHKYVGVARGWDHPEKLIPSFYPMLPGVMAGLGLLAGKAFVFHVPGLLIGLSCLLLLSFMRLIAGWHTAVAATAAFGLSPVVLWFAGFPTGEVLSLFYLLCFLLLWSMARRGPTAILAGLLLLSILLLSLSSVVGLALACICLVMKAMCLSLKNNLRYMPAGVVLLLLGQWMQHGVWSPTYAQQMGSYIPHLMSFLPVATVAGLMFLGLMRSLRFWTSSQKPLRIHASVLGLLLVIAGCAEFMGFKGMLPWGRIAGMFSPWGAVAITVGAGLWLLRCGRDALLLLLLATGFTGLFIASPMMSDNFPWAYKRFLPFTVPIACCALGFLVGEAFKVRGYCRYLLLLLFGLSIALPLYHGRHWAFIREWQGAYALLEQVDAALPEDAVIMAPVPYAEPLEFILGHTVLPIYSFEAGGELPLAVLSTAEQLKQDGKRMYFFWPRRLRALNPPLIKQVGKFRPEEAPSKWLQAKVPTRGLDRKKTLVVDLRLDEYLGAQKKRLE